MGDMLSQAEIDALLGGTPEPEPSSDDALDVAADTSGTYTEPSIPETVSEELSEETIIPAVLPADRSGAHLTEEQEDILGEIGNISMGTAATTLFTLLNQKVWITTPHVQEISWEELKSVYDRPCVAIRVGYKVGLVGSNVLILKERDVKIIANLMMGGDGTGPDIDGELTEIDLSAIGEAMNQMVGSSSTSLSSLTKMKIDIDTPVAFKIDFEDDAFFEQLGVENGNEDVISIQFKMEVGNLIDSQIMQMLPVNFAIGMVDALKNKMSYEPEPDTDIPQLDSSPPSPPAPEPPPPPSAPPMDMGQQMPQGMSMGQQQMQPQMPQGMDMMGAQPQMYDQSAYGMPQPQMQQPQMQMPPQMQMQPRMQMQPQMYQMPQMPQQQQVPQQNVNVQAAQFQNFDYSGIMQQKENIGIIMDVPLEVNVELGRTTRLIKEILEFGPGTVVELNKLAGEPVDIYVNGKHVAKGEVVVIDENFGVRIVDIVSVENRI